MNRVDNAFGDLIREQRKKLGLSQEAVAAELKIHRVTYTNIENGKQVISLEYAILLSRLLKLSLDEFVTSLSKEDSTLVTEKPSKKLQSEIDKIKEEIRSKLKR